MKRRLLALAGLVGVLTTLLLVGLEVVAAADEPQAQGWWTVAQFRA